jgi:hypothetical protein
MAPRKSKYKKRAPSRRANKKAKRKSPKKSRRHSVSIKKSTKGGNAYYRPTLAGAGMTKKGVEAYRRANPGSKLQTAVTAKNVKKGSKAWRRRKSYCARSAGQLRNSSPETRNNPNSRINQARRRWRC